VPLAPAAGASDVAPTTEVAATLQPAPANATLTVRGPLGTPIAGTTEYDVATGRLTFTPTQPLAWATAYTATVTAAAGVVNGGTWSFTTVSEPLAIDATTIFGTGMPQHPWWEDHDAVQVATRFTVAEGGTARAVRFYKGSANTGSHTGYLWRTSDGAKLAEAAFSGETAEGWQTAHFTTPVILEAGVEYRVGLYSTTGRYAVDLGGLTATQTLGSFTIPARGSAFVYGRGYPAAVSAHNYWVDILFESSG